MTFLTKNVNYGHFIHLHDFSNEKRQKKKKMFIHNTFYEFREFGCFRKIPRSTLIRYLHDLRFFMIFPHSRLLDLHGYIRYSRLVLQIIKKLSIPDFECK